MPKYFNRSVYLMMIVSILISFFFIVNFAKAELLAVSEKPQIYMQSLAKNLNNEKT